MSEPLQTRLPQLDFLRTVAVLLVIGNHSAICPPETSFFLNRMTSVWSRGGWSGVDLFFVLSGFLIGGLLFGEYKKRGAIDIRKFLIRRGFKIYPAFWFFILITLVVEFLSNTPIYLGGYVSELLFIQNYHPHIWDHTWSLAVEEHFYIFLSLLLGALIFFGNKNNRNDFGLIPKIFVFFAVICLAMRVISDEYFGFVYGIGIEATHLRIDSLFYGVLLAYLWNFRGLSENKFLNQNKLLIGLAGVLCFVPVFVFDLFENFWIETFGLTMLYLGGGCLLLALVKYDFGKSKILRFFSKVGKYSYSIYLWNLPSHIWLTKFTSLAHENWYLYAILYWSATFLLGYGTAKLVEYPMLRVREKLFPANVAAIGKA